MCRQTKCTTQHRVIGFRLVCLVLEMPQASDCGKQRKRAGLCLPDEDGACHVGMDADCAASDVSPIEKTAKAWKPQSDNMLRHRRLAAGEDQSVATISHPWGFNLQTEVGFRFASFLASGDRLPMSGVGVWRPTTGAERHRRGNKSQIVGCFGQARDWGGKSTDVHKTTVLGAAVSDPLDVRWSGPGDRMQFREASKGGGGGASDWSRGSPIERDSTTW